MNIIELFSNGPLRPLYLIAERVAVIVPDSLYLRLIYRLRLKKSLNLKKPVTFNEKLQWLKINDRQDRYTDMVDKYAVKALVADAIGEEHVIPTLGVWDKYEDIDLAQLPNSFVLKCTHDSGSVLVVNDKNDLDEKKAKKHFREALKRNYYWGNREWPYKNVKPRIIAEPLIPELGNPDSTEYKITCFNGKLAFTTICTGKAHSKLKERKNDFYDPQFNTLPFYSFYKHSDHPMTEKPKLLDDMIRYAEKIAEGIPYLRVDFYVVDDNILFGEATFFTWGGFNKFVPEEWDKILGDSLSLPVDESRRTHGV